MKIIFVDIPGFPGYKAGSDGHIYSFLVGNTGRVDYDRTPRCLKGHRSTTSRYLFVALRKGGRTFLKRVHSLVCMAFHGLCPNGLETSHVNGNIYDNIPGNLCWETRRENLARKKIHGTDDTGFRNSRALFDAVQLAEIRLRLARGDTARSIAALFGCDDREIGKIKRGERYKGQ